jgi:hypothetical protein
MPKQSKPKKKVHKTVREIKISNAKTYEIPEELKRLRDVGVQKILADLKLEASAAEKSLTGNRTLADNTKGAYTKMYSGM